MKEKAMSSLSPYLLASEADGRDDSGAGSLEPSHKIYQPFVSLLELVSEIYKVNLLLQFFL